MSKVKRVRGTSPKEAHRHLFLEISEQWSAWFSSRAKNWYDFTLLNAAFEWERCTGRVELTFGILGLCVELTYIYDDSFTHRMTSLTDQIADEIKAQISAETGVPVENIELCGDAQAQIEKIEKQIEERRAP